MQKAYAAGIMLVLRYMLRRYHAQYMLQGKITYNQYKDWIDIYTVYKKLGGNSIAVEWNEDIQKLEKCESVSDMSVYEAMVIKQMQNSQKRGV